MSKITASNISLEVTQAQVKQFFSFCGRIENISLEKGANYQTAIITFERASAAKTALLLQDAVLGMNKITITSDDKLDDDRDLTGHEGDVLPQEHKPRTTIIAEILSHGYVLGDQAAAKSIEFDQSTGISSTFKSFLGTVQKKTTELDQQLGVSGKMKEIDEKLKVSENTQKTTGTLQSSFNSLWSQVASHPYAQKAQSYLAGPLANVNDIHSEARKMANVRQGGTESAKPGDVIHESNPGEKASNDPAQTSGVSAASVPKLGATSGGSA